MNKEGNRTTPLRPKLAKRAQFSGSDDEIDNVSERETYSEFNENGLMIKKCLNVDT